MYEGSGNYGLLAHSVQPDLISQYSKVDSVDPRQDYSEGDRVINELAQQFENTLTIEICLEFCKDYKYASVQKRYCHCANEFARKTELLADSQGFQKARQIIQFLYNL